MDVLLFGILKDITGNDRIALNGVKDTDELMKKLRSMYPKMENAECMIAVDRNIIQVNTLLQENAEVAVLPPFSGG